MPFSYPSVEDRDTKQSPAVGCETVDASASDHDLARPSRAIYVGTAGALAVTFVDGSTATLVGASGFLPLQVITVLNTGTSADDIVALY